MASRGRLTVARIRAARWVLLAVAVVVAVVLGTLYVLGRGARVELPEDDATTPDERAQQIGRGFDHTVTHEGKPLLRIRGQRDRRDAQGNLHVEEVLISAFSEDGTRYEVASDAATYNLETREAVLRGHVSLAGPDGFALRTEELILRNGGRALETKKQVRFQYGAKNPLIGRARALRAQINRGEFFLSDGVDLRTQRPGEENPFELGAERVLFERKMHQVRAEGKVLVRWGDSHLRAERVAAHLAPDERRLQFLRARWQLRAVLIERDASGERRLLAEGESLALLLDEQGRTPTRLELDGGGGQRAHLRRALPASDTAFDLVAARVEAELVGGRLNSITAGGGVTLVDERPAGDRRLAARQMNGQFAADGTLAHLEAQGEVKLAAEGNDIAAERAVMTPDRTEAFGEPVVLNGERGELRAPRVVYTPNSGLVHALGGVEATLVGESAGPLRRTPLASGDEPIRVQAEEAFWREDPQSFLFRGKVRAWSGDRVLRADQLRGEAATQRLAAAGGVETVWFMPPPEEGSTAEGATAAPRQVRVNADSLVYDEGGGVLEYEGGVRVVDGQRTLSSRELEVELDEEGEARRLVASGEVALEAPAEGRTITAERADYDLVAEQVVFHGSPVTLKDEKGGTLNGAQAVYSVATGKVRVTGAPEPIATPTPAPTAAP